MSQVMHNLKLVLQALITGESSDGSTRIVIRGNNQDISSIENASRCDNNDVRTTISYVYHGKIKNDNRKSYRKPR